MSRATQRRAREGRESDTTFRHPLDGWGASWRPAWKTRSVSSSGGTKRCEINRKPEPLRYEKTMKTLIVEDDFTSRLLLQQFLKSEGPAHIAVNGNEAVAAVKAALDADERYDLICLDIMMPVMDGQEALRKIRALEAAKGINSSHGAKIVMTTALADMRNVTAAYSGLCDAYLTKPILKAKLLEKLRELALID
jgi:two-component system, chemotaxis family, chemotaxis protein CheY